MRTDAVALRGFLWRADVATNRRKITVLLSAAEHERFEAYCNERGYNKSTLIARLIREHLNSEPSARQLPLRLKTTRENADE